ncbi:hypothetical protein BH23PLA1_BH23PLA1_44140 [soil metagenome]
MTRTESNRDPDAPAWARAAAEALRKAHAVGLVREHPGSYEPDAADVRRMAARARAAGVGIRAADRVLAESSSPDDVIRGLRELSASLDESPLPKTEWSRLLPVLGRDLLAPLTETSPSSVARYARGERDTPDPVNARLHTLALIVGDLTGAYNDIGIRRWFERRRTALDGRSPAQVLAGAWDPDADRPRRVRELARALTASPAT